MSEVVPPPLKLDKNMIFWRKVVIFHTKYPKNFAPPSAIGKNMIFWRKVVIFHTKYPQKDCVVMTATIPEIKTMFGSALPPIV
jgi:hypothetical protein